MSAGAGGVALPESQQVPYSASPSLRLKVEQASYAYAASWWRFWGRMRAGNPRC